MEFNLDIKGCHITKEKKPWTRVGWLQEHDSEAQTYFMNRNSLCQVSVERKTTSKTFPALSSIKSQISLLSISSSGSHVAGLVSSGDLFIWSRMTDVLETHVTPFSKLASNTAQPGTFTGYTLYVSTSGEQVLVVTATMEMFLWEMGKQSPQWWKLFSPEGVKLPIEGYKETSIDAGFYVHQALEEICVWGLVFNDRTSSETIITHLLISWPSLTAKFYTHRSPLAGVNYLHQAFSAQKLIDGMGDVCMLDFKKDIPSTPSQFGALWSDPPPFRVSWSSVSCRSSSGPTHNGRGTYIYRLSPSGDVSALVVNERKAKKTRIHFLSPFFPEELSSSVYSQENTNTGRMYWVTDVSWSSDGLVLACVTRKGCLFILTRFGEPLTLIVTPDTPVIGDGGQILQHVNAMMKDGGLQTHIPIPIGKKHVSIDHDNSDSSEKDSTSPRFSVACHPYLPQLACSDGYTLSLFEWDPSPVAAADPFSQDHTHPNPATQDLLGLVKGLVTASNKKLGGSSLEQQEQISTILKKDASLVESEGNRTLDFLASMARSDLNGAAVLSSTLKSHAKNAELAQPRLISSQKPGLAPMSMAVERDRKSLAASIPLLQAAAGILLTCEPFVPFNGMLPKTKSLELEEVSVYRSELNATSCKLVSTIFTVISELNMSTSTLPASDQPVEVNTVSHDFITSLLKLVALDKLKQSQMDFSISIANAIILGFISGLNNVQRKFIAVQKNKHTLKSLKLYTDWVTTSLLDVYNLLEEVVSVLETTYATRHSVLGDLLRMTEATKEFKNQPPPRCVQYLASSLNAVLSIVSALWRDVKQSRELAKSFSNLPTTSTQKQWIATLYKQFKKSASNASTTIKALHYYVYHISNKKQVTSKPSLSSSPLRLEDKNPPILIEDDISPLLLEDDNPITYTLVRKDLKNMLEQLLQYDMKGVMDVVYGCIQEYGETDDTDGQVSVSLSAERLSDILDSSVVSRPDASTYVCIKSEPARFIVGVLGDLMSSYFTNQQLLVLLSSNTTLSERHAELSRQKLSVALREQGISDEWTVERAVNLLLLSGKWEKACDFVIELGDWRKAFVLAAIFTVHGDWMSRKQGDSVHSPSGAAAIGDILSDLTHHLALSNILKVLGSLHRKTAKLSQKPSDSGDGGTDNLPGKIFEQFLSETFHVCAVCGVDSVLRSCADHYLKELVSLTVSLSVQVHPGLYLPAPPLFYVQPTLTEEEFVQCPEEHAQRGNLNSAIKNLVMVLKASNSLQTCALWYSAQLHSSFLHHKESEGLQVPGDSQQTSFPRYLKKLSQCGTPRDQVSADMGRLFEVFRKFCVLMWYLHVRDWASLYLRKLQPSLSKGKNQSSDGRNAALWSSRLLSFITLLSSSDLDIEDLVMSVLSELPTDMFLAEVLAFCFPSGGRVEGGKDDAKLKRIVARMDAAQLSSSSLQVKHVSLSEHYHLKSGAVLKNRSKVFGECSGRLNEGFFELSADTKDLNVGSLLLEHDTSYFSFLETLFEIILPPLNEVLMASGSNYSIQPYLSEFHSGIDLAQESSQVASGLYPLLHSLIRWAQMPYPQVIPRDSRSDVKLEPAGRKKLAQRRQSLNSTTMRVNLSVPVIVGCLMQLEELGLGRVAAEGSLGQVRKEGSGHMRMERKEGLGQVRKEGSGRVRMERKEGPGQMREEPRGRSEQGIKERKEGSGQVKVEPIEMSGQVRMELKERKEELGQERLYQLRQVKIEPQGRTGRMENSSKEKTDDNGGEKVKHRDERVVPKAPRQDLPGKKSVTIAEEASCPVVADESTHETLEGTTQDVNTSTLTTSSTERVPVATELSQNAEDKETSRSSARMHAGMAITNHSWGEHFGVFPLLGIPEGVLQGEFTPEMSEMALRLSPNRHPVVMEERKEMVQETLHSLTETCTEDVNLVMSTSTSELPTDITFSVGEVGSSVKPFPPQSNLRSAIHPLTSTMISERGAPVGMGAPTDEASIGGGTAVKKSHFYGSVENKQGDNRPRRSDTEPDRQPLEVVMLEKRNLVDESSLVSITPSSSDTLTASTVSLTELSPNSTLVQKDKKDGNEKTDKQSKIKDKKVGKGKVQQQVETSKLLEDSTHTPSQTHVLSPKKKSKALLLSSTMESDSGALETALPTPKPSPTEVPEQLKLAAGQPGIQENLQGQVLAVLLTSLLVGRHTSGRPALQDGLASLAGVLTSLQSLNASGGALSGQSASNQPAPSSRPASSQPAPSSQPASSQPAPSSQPASSQPAPSSRPASSQPAPSSQPAQAQKKETELKKLHATSEAGEGDDMQAKDGLLLFRDTSTLLESESSEVDGETESSLPQTLDIEDLKSSSYTEPSVSHVTIPIYKTTSLPSTIPSLPSTTRKKKHSSRTQRDKSSSKYGDKGHISSSKHREASSSKYGDNSSREHRDKAASKVAAGDLYLEDLESTDTISPGAIPLLSPSHTQTSTTQTNTEALHKKFPKQARFGPQSTEPFCGIPLLHMDPEPSKPNLTQCDLEQIYPEVMENLRQFDKSVAPRGLWGSKLPNATGLGAPAHTFPLLSLPKELEDRAPPRQNSSYPQHFPAFAAVPQMSQGPTPFSTPSHQPKTPSHQPQTPSHQSQTPSHQPQALQMPAFPLFQLPHHQQQQQQQQPAQSQIPLLPLIPPNYPPQPSQINLPHPPPDFQLPEFQPFVPLLIPPSQLFGEQTVPPTLKQQEPVATAPRLLKADDPLSRMKETGFKLLSFEVESEVKLASRSIPDENTIAPPMQGQKITSSQEASSELRLSDDSRPQHFLSTYKGKKKYEKKRKLQPKRSPKHRTEREIDITTTHVTKPAELPKKAHGKDAKQTVKADAVITAKQLAPKKRTEKSLLAEKTLMKDRTVVPETKERTVIPVPDSIPKFPHLASEKLSSPEVGSSPSHTTSKHYFSAENLLKSYTAVKPSDTPKRLLQSTLPHTPPRKPVDSLFKAKVRSEEFFSDPLVMTKDVIEKTKSKSGEVLLDSGRDNLRQSSSGVALREHSPVTFSTLSESESEREPPAEVLHPESQVSTNLQPTLLKPSLHPTESVDFPDEFPPLESLEVRRLTLQAVGRSESESTVTEEEDRILNATITIESRGERREKEEEQRVASKPLPLVAPPLTEAAENVQATSISPLQEPKLAPITVPPSLEKPTLSSSTLQNTKSHSSPEIQPKASHSSGTEFLDRAELSIARENSDSVMEVVEQQESVAFTEKMSDVGISSNASPLELRSSNQLGFQMSPTLKPPELQTTEVSPSSSVGIQVGFEATPPINLEFSEEVKVEELDLPSLESLKHRDGNWRDTVDRLHLLDEQLKVLETTAKGMEGGLKNTGKLLRTIDNLAMVSDALTGTAQSSEDHTPLFLSQDEDDMDDDLLLKLLPTTSSPRLRVPHLQSEENLKVERSEQEIALPIQQQESAELQEAPVPEVPVDSQRPGLPVPSQRQEVSRRRDTMKGKLKRKRSDNADDADTTVSSLVLRHGEKWSKEKLRNYVSYRKKQKSAAITSKVGSEKTEKKSPNVVGVGSKGSVKASPKMRENSRRLQEEDFRTKRIADAYSLMKDILSSKPVIQPEPAVYESSSPRSPKEALKYLMPQVSPYKKTKSPYYSDPRTPKQKKFVAMQKSATKRSSMSSQSTHTDSISSATTKSLERQISKEIKRGFEEKGVFNFTTVPEVAKLSATRKVHFSGSKETSGAHASQGQKEKPPQLQPAPKTRRTKATAFSSSTPQSQNKRLRLAEPQVSPKQQQKQPLLDSSVKGLLEVGSEKEEVKAEGKGSLVEKQRISQLLECSDLEPHSVTSSTSIMSNIDWEQVDKILDS